MSQFSTFPQAISHAFSMMLRQGVKIHRGRWQGIDVARRPDAATFELHHHTMQVPMATTDLDFYRRGIKPNLPWADDHFLERVGRNPLNPGVEWRNWPWGQSADKSRIDPVSLGDPTPERIFDHTYAQRYWPKWAGRYPGGILPDDFDASSLGPNRPHRGIYFDYGDLDDVVTELQHDPTTRQAILPVFFPEDTGYRPGRRKPCSLFYHFMLTSGQLDISYQLRSCDITHHFRDDIYLTVRLLLWMLDELRLLDPGFWLPVVPGYFVMQIANLHCFVNDYLKLEREHGSVE